MNVSSRTLLLVVICAASFTAHATSAAPGAQPQRVRLTQGIVTGVHHINGQAAFRVRTIGMNNAGALVANQNGAAGALAANGAAAVVPVAERFLVGPGTIFEASLSGNLMPASFGALRSGQRVMIQSEGAQAMRVRIVGSQRNPYRGRGMAGMGYPAGMYRQHAMRPSAMAVAAPVCATPAASVAKPHHTAHRVK